jgi:SpoVK/Ycf46/Vps4 family AAA+-type ATPase
VTKVVFLAAKMQKPLLLERPAGSGKTEIARTLGNEGGLGFLAATTADVKANFLGQSGNRVMQLFERAPANAPVILFLDELDIIAPARNGSNDALTDEIVGQLLQELDGIQSRDSEVFLLAATNHVDQIDRAVLSRFQETLAIPLPDLIGRQRLKTVFLQKKRLAFDLQEGARALAEVSEGKGMSGRDLGSWIGRAEQKALLRAIAAGGPDHFALTLGGLRPAGDGIPCRRLSRGLKPIDRSKAPCVCGDLNSLLLSTDTLPRTQQKMQRWIENGAKLAGSSIPSHIYTSTNPVKSQSRSPDPSSQVRVR